MQELRKLFNERKLRADEIEVRVAMTKRDGCQLLLYKDARVDMNILDEIVGPMNWQRDHKELKGNIYCGVGIWDSEKQQWIWKWDCGKESNTEAEKGASSDSFKRACVNATGVGRELYTAPFIWIPAGNVEIKEENGKIKTYDKFCVEQIMYDGNRIIALSIINATKRRRVYIYDVRKKA